MRTVAAYGWEMAGNQMAPAFVWMTTARDVAWRWRRFLIATIAAALVLALTVILSGIIEHLDDEIRRTVDALGAEAFAVDEAVPGPFMTVAAVPAAAEEALAAAQKGATVAPLIALPQTLRLEEPLDVYLIGHRPGSLGAPAVVEGRAPAADGEIALDEKAGLAIGDEAVLSKATLKVVGITRGLTVLGERPNVYVTVSDAQRIVFGGQPVVTGFLVEREGGTAPAGLKLVDKEAAIADLRRPLGDTIESIELFRFLLWIVAAAIVGSVLYLSALERARDMAVFKATGASNADLIGGLVLQALALALTASVVAIVVAMLLAPLFPAGISLPASLLSMVPVVAVVVGIVGSLAGLRRTLAADPAAAFGGP
jgi:putative ABC transport system permease protein